MSAKTSTFIYEEIKRDITRNVYQPHQRIAEDDLAKKFGVSRTPVREAIRLLEQDGFVTCVKNVGTFIRPISASEISDFFDVRSVLEGLTARLCAQRPTPQLIAELRESVQAVISAHHSRDLDAANRLDTEFHGKIAAAAGNEFANRCLLSMGDRLLWFLNISNLSRIDYLDSVPFDHMKNSHQMILDAIGSGDPAAAEQQARAHVDEAKHYFIEYCYNRFML